MSVLTIQPPSLATAAREVPVAHELVFHSTLGTLYGTNLTGSLEYIWNFGDNESSMTGHADTASHTYTTPGIYTITLNIIYLDSQVRFSSLVMNVLGELVLIVINVM